MIDGELQGESGSVGDAMDKQSDGTWLMSGDETISALCTSLDPGKHVVQIQDDNGKVYAQGSFTIEADTATPTPGAINSGVVLVMPALFSCSSSGLSVDMAIVLPSWVPGDEEVTLTIDGKTISTQTVSTGFEQQSDGSWLSSGSGSASKLCGFGTGAHSLKVLDAANEVIAEGTFTTE
jgi:hypothetical protein